MLPADAFQRHQQPFPDWRVAARLLAGAALFGAIVGGIGCSSAQNPLAPRGAAIATIKVVGEQYRVLLTTDAQIAAARAAQAGGRDRIPNGRLVAGAQVNTGYAWHVEDVEFAFAAIEVCDGLPSYVEDGQTIRLKGQGDQGPGGAGDALVKIRLRSHPLYRVDGRDLHVDLPVSLKDAVLGAKLAVDTPTGRLAVNVPEWSSSDKVLRIKGRGLPEKAGGHGDMYAHVRVMLPEGGDAALEELMRKSNG
jgi:hypothetical protein